MSKLPTLLAIEVNTYSHATSMFCHGSINICRVFAEVDNTRPLPRMLGGKGWAVGPAAVATTTGAVAFGAGGTRFAGG